YSGRYGAAASADPFIVSIFETIVVAGNFLSLWSVAVFLTNDMFTLDAINCRIRRCGIVNALRSNSRYVPHDIFIGFVHQERYKLHSNPQRRTQTAIYIHLIAIVNLTFGKSLRE